MVKTKTIICIISIIMIALASHYSASWPGVIPTDVNFNGVVYIDGLTAPNGVNLSVYSIDNSTGLPFVVVATVTMGGAGMFPALVVTWDDPDSGADEGVEYSITGEDIWFAIDYGNISEIDGLVETVPPFNPYSDPITNGTAPAYATVRVTDAQEAKSFNANYYFDTPFYLISPANTSFVINNTPTFDWAGYENGYRNYTLVIDDSANMATPVLTVSDINVTTYTLTPGQALATNIYYWRVDGYNNGIYYKSSGVFNFEIDVSSPLITLYSPVNYSWSTQANTEVNITTNEDSTCKWDIAGSTAYGAKSDTMTGATTFHTDLFTPTVQGTNLFYVQCEDTAGNTMNITDEEVYSIRYDSIDPAAGQVTTEANATYLADTTVDFTWSGYSDGGSGLLTYYYSFANNQGTRTGTADLATPGQLTGATQGTNTVYVWAEDLSGNIGLSASDSIIVDTINPSYSGWVENPVDLRDNYVGAFTVDVNITETNWNASVLPEFRWRWSTGGWSAWADMVLLAGMTYRLSITDTWSTHQDEILYYEVNSTDNAGNYNVTQQTETNERYNVAPILTPLPGTIAAVEKQNLSFTISATDADGDVLTFTSNHNFTFTRLTDTSAIAWWVPPNSHVGDNTVRFNVSDGAESDSQVVTISVTPTNDAPVLDPVGDLTAYLHKPFMHYLTGSDPDNQNSYILDNNLLIFDKTQNYRWFSIESFFNASNASYYGLINFTPLLSHRGTWEIDIYVTDGTDTDSEKINFTVGYCGDLDAGSEPWCDASYENCVTCERDCGKCSDSQDDFMAIIIDPRNCLERNFTIWTYQLWNRATCPIEGRIIDDMEVCENLSQTKIEVFFLVKRQWEKIDEYISDDDGEITFVPLTIGEYKLVATKRGYPTAYEYLEIRPCIEDDEKTDVAVNKTEKPPVVDKPGREDEPEDEITGDIVEDASTFSIILWYILVPTLTIIMVVLGYYYYEKEKDNQPWILKSRIWAVQKYRIVKAEVLKYWDRLLKYLKYKK